MFKFTPQKNFYLLSFFRDKPSWELFSRNGSQKVDRPVRNSGIPVLAVIPDRYFFFYIPRGLQGKNRRYSREATSLQLSHLFPSPGQGENLGVLDTGNEILGFFRRADFGHFLEQNKDDLAMAGTVTTSFLLGRALMAAENTSSWYICNPGDPLILVREDRLDYFCGDDQELKTRLGGGDSEQNPLCTGYAELVSRLLYAAVPWNRFRFSIPELEAEHGETKFLTRTAAVILLAGLLFCAGEILKLASARSHKNTWENALDSLYSSALGPDYGSDPYGLLLYRASLTRNKERSGPDFADLLRTLSSAAPDSLVVESLSMGIDSGLIRAYIGSYDEMENFINRLKDNDGYSFTLDQADSADGSVNLILRVNY